LDYKDTEAHLNLGFALSKQGKNLRAALASYDQAIASAKAIEDREMREKFLQAASDGRRTVLRGR
jgi:hypothetical protein